MKNKIKKVDDLTPLEIDELFTFMITEDMPNEEFKKFINGWFDDQLLMDIMEDWSSDIKRGALINYYKNKELPIL